MVQAVQVAHLVQQLAVLAVAVAQVAAPLVALAVPAVALWAALVALAAAPLAVLVVPVAAPPAALAALAAAPLADLVAPVAAPLVALVAQAAVQWVVWVEALAQQRLVPAAMAAVQATRLVAWAVPAAQVVTVPKVVKRSAVPLALWPAAADRTPLPEPQVPMAVHWAQQAVTRADHKLVPMAATPMVEPAQSHLALVVVPMAEAILRTEMPVRVAVAAWRAGPVIPMVVPAMPIQAARQQLVRAVVVPVALARLVQPVQQVQLVSTTQLLAQSVAMVQAAQPVLVQLPTVVRPGQVRQLPVVWLAQVQQLPAA